MQPLSLSNSRRFPKRNSRLINILEIGAGEPKIQGHPPWGRSELVASLEETWGWWSLPWGCFGVWAALPGVVSSSLVLSEEGVDPSENHRNLGLELDWWVGHLVMLLSYRFKWMNRIRLRPLVFKALGCISAVASSHPLCVGKTEELALTFKTTDAPKELDWWRTLSRPVWLILNWNESPRKKRQRRREP